MQKIIPCISPYLRHIGWMTVAWDYICSIQSFEFIVPRFKPVNHDGVRKNRQHTFVKSHITSNHKAFTRKPDGNIPRAMSWTKVEYFNNETPNLQGETILKGFCGEFDAAIFSFFTIVPLHSFQFKKSQVFKFMGCIYVSNDLHSLINPVSIAKVCVALSIFIYNKDDRFICHCLNFLMQRFGQNICSTGIDHNHTLSCHNKG